MISLIVFTLFNASLSSCIILVVSEGDEKIFNPTPQVFEQTRWCGRWGAGGSGCPHARCGGKSSRGARDESGGWGPSGSHHRHENGGE